MWGTTDGSTGARATPGQDYWRESRRPLASLAFVLPLLLTYEFGVWRLGPDAIRNGADIWLRTALDTLGFGQYFLLPALTAAVLLAWHHTTGQPWRFPPTVLQGMGLECMVLALGLFALAHLQGALFQALSLELPAASIASARAQPLGRLIAFLGAGIYEELLFRLMLLPAAIAIVKALGANPRFSRAAAVVLTSLLFAGAHYAGSGGETFAWFSFLFRVSAGILFSLLFVHRGFGITAGAHAGYDCLVGLL